MTLLHYTFNFDNIKGKFHQIQVINHSNGNKIHYPKFLVNDYAFFNKTNMPLTPQLADLVDIGVAIAIADRLACRQPNNRTGIHINLPLRNPELFKSAIKKLSDVLFWFTEDNWTFDFTSRTEGRLTESQLRLPNLSYHSGLSREVALSSDGLDSLAGLCNKLVENPNVSITLLGTGINTQVLARQKQIIKQLSHEKFNNVKLLQVPIIIKYSDGMKKEKRPRARGFVFMVIGAVCAVLEGQNVLQLYENGIGALNLRFSDAATGLDHLRPVHPLSLIFVSEFVSSILEQTFTIQNPFLFQTKGQMCKVFPKLNMVDLIFETFTCTHLNRVEGGLQHCGYCASCLLRQQALVLQGIEDKTLYYSEEASRVYFNHISCQVRTLGSILQSENPWQELTRKYSDAKLLKVFDKTQNGDELKDGLLMLYRTYVDEWNAVKNVIGARLP